MRKMNLVYGLILGILVAFTFTLGFTIVEVGAIDANATDTINVRINISKKAIVDISPASINWTTPIDPGSNGTYRKIQIDNMGSINITHIWFNNSYPDSNPFGTGLSSAYDAGNFMAITNDSTGDSYLFPNRVDYNTSYEIIYLTGPNSNTPPNVPYGRFKNASNEWFWAVTSGGVNYTNGSIYISSTPHTQTQTGDADLSDNAPNNLEMVTDGPEAGEWGVTDAGITVGSDNICAAVYYNGSKVMFYKWNMDAPGNAEVLSGPSCPNSEYFLNGTAQGNIVPGASAYARIMPLVPYGVVYNQTDPEITGTVTVLVRTE
jgi:hypothetical protein